MPGCRLAASGANSHYTEAKQMDGVLRDFYELFLGNIEKAYARGRKPGESPN